MTSILKAESLRLDDPGAVEPHTGPARIWSLLIGPLVTCLLALAAAVQSLRLWDWRPGLPLSLSGDAPVALLQVREIMQGNWFRVDDATGAPFGSNMGWFPTGNAVHVPLIRFLALFCDSPATVATVFFVLQFPLAALTAYWLSRTLDIPRPMAVCVGVLFAVLPGHQLWFGHLWLAAYWAVPLALWLVLGVARGQILLPSLGDLRSAGPQGRQALGLAARTVAVVVAVGLSDVYYVAFSLILLTAVLMVRLAGGARWRTLLQGAAVTAGTAALCVLSLLTASRGRSADLVTGPLPAHRVIGESERYAGKLVELVLPWYQHRAAPLRLLTWAYSVATTPSVERPALGVVALAGVCGLVWTAGASVTARRAASTTTGWLAVLVLVCLAFYTRAGLGSLVALLVTPEIRTWSRFVVFIDLIGLVAVAHWLSSKKRLQGRRVAWPVAAVVIVVGVLDQTNPAAAPDYASLAAKQAQLRAFGAGLHSAVGDCAVFQLPVVSFPEEPPPGQMDDYDHLLPTLFAPAGLRWSYGAIRGTSRADWQLALPVGDTPQLLEELAAGGYCAVEVDRAGYALAKDPTGQIARVLGPTASQSTDGTLSAYSLQPLRNALKQRSAAQQAQERDDVLHPTLVSLSGSLVTVDSSRTPRQWTGPTATLQVANMGDTTRHLRVSLDVKALDGRAGTIAVAGSAVTPSAIELTRRGTRAVLQIQAGQGLTTITLTSKATVVPVPGEDQAQAALEISDLRAEDLSSTANASTLQQFAAQSAPSGR